MRKKECSTYREYLSLLQDNNEFNSFKNTLLVNVTRFFRDPTVFESFLKFFKIYIHEIVNRSRNFQLQIWSAGCANGSETYSIALTICNALKHHLSRYKVKIYGTDINNDVLAIAKSGIYPTSLINEVPSSFLNEFFSSEVSKYILKPQVKNLVEFYDLDLLSNSFPFTNLDIIFCRYVLMYFKKSQQKHLINKFYELLKPGGVLLLGYTDPMPLTEQNLFIPFEEQNLFIPWSLEDRIFQKPLSNEQRDSILASYPEELFFCEFCGKIFYNPKKLKSHLSKAPCRHGILFCYICNKRHFSRTGLVAHLRYSHYIDRNDRISLIFNKYRDKINYQPQ